MMGQGRGRGGPASMGGGASYNKQFAYRRDEYGDENDDDDMDDDGMDYYDDEQEDDSEAMDSDRMDPSYQRNAPPGSMFQGAPNSMSAAANFSNQGYGGKTGPAGVPFYGQQNKPVPSQGLGMGMGMGGMGMGMGMGLGMGMGAASMGAGLGSGGSLAYGMASQGGSLFGPASGGATSAFGASQATKSPGIMQFGSISSFGGMGGAGAFGGGGSLFGAASSNAADDPYANIAIDLTKVKKSEPPAKPYEQKTEEEKKKEQDKRLNASVKSNLKKEEEEDLNGKRKRSVSFGKSTTFEVSKHSDNDDDSVDYNSSNAGGKGSPRPKKVLEEKDIGDGLDEKERIKQRMEEEEKAQLEEIKQMEAWKQKQEQLQTTTQVKKPADKSKTALVSQHEDSIGDSSSGYNKPEESEKGSDYTESFDDASASGSNSKQKLTYWPGKSEFGAAKKSEESIASLSNDKDDGVCDANAMEAYLKKQQQMKQAQSSQAQKPTQNSTASKLAVADPNESSSGKYEDEEFDSYSQSKSGNIPIVPAQNVASQSKNSTEYKPPQSFQPQQTAGASFKSVLESYVKKENKFIQTDQTKYHDMSAADALSQGNSGSYKEWTLQQNLKDAESIIQELKAKEAENKQKIFDFESQLKKKDVEFQTQRRELLNATETAKRAQEQYKDACHKNNLYKIETEELIKQIDVADAKTREKEDDLRLAKAEFERKLEQHNERMLFKKGKQEERDTYEMKREHMIQKEELQKKIDDQSEELDYFQQKVAKLEAETRSMRVGNNPNKRVKELEDEVALLKSQVSDSYKVQQENVNLRNIKNELSREDQVKLQRELAQLELMVKGYQEENEKAVVRQKQLEKDNKTAIEKLYQEQRRVKDLQQKVLLDRDKVYVEEKAPELDIQTVNTMGLGNAISQKELAEMHETIKKLQLDKSDLERELSLKEGSMRSQVNKARDEKALVEKNLFEMEILVRDRERDITKLKDDYLKEKQLLVDKTQVLEEKVQWFRENQKLLAEEHDEKENSVKEMQMMRERLKRAEEDAKRTKDLEKKCKLLEETIKSKNPNSIQMLLQATMQENQQSSKSDNQEKQQYKSRIKELECELEERDKDFEKRVRTLRQEQERMKQMYEKRQGQTPEIKKIAELEEELTRTKNYYNKRIREIEEKYKYRSGSQQQQPTTSVEKNAQTVPSTAGHKAQSKAPPLLEDSQKQHYEQQIEQLIKERNLLAQKLVNQETTNNRRRQSLQGGSQTDIFGSFADGSGVPYSNLQQIFGKIKRHSASDKDGIFSLIQDALTQVEQLKSGDPNKSSLSQKLLALTEELGQKGVLSQSILASVNQICDKALGVGTSQPQHKQMSSAANKDISIVLSEDRKAESSPTKPPKPSQQHAFSLQEPTKKTTKDVLKALVYSGLDFQQLLAENGIKSKRISIQKLYSLFKDEPSLKSVTLDDVKQIQQYVRDRSGVASQEIGAKSAEEIDIQDLSNVILDVSVEFNLDQEAEKRQDWTAGGAGSNRYSQERPSSALNNSRVGAEINAHSDQAIVLKLKEKVRQLKEERDDQEQESKERMKKLQRALSELTQDKQRLEERLEKVEQSKNRMEKILKSNLGLKGTLKKDSDNNELLDEVGFIMKRIEYLEQQSEERAKQATQEHGPCKRELQRMHQALEEERQDKARLLAKKNAEVAYFRAELDALLAEMKNKLV